MNVLGRARVAVFVSLVLLGTVVKASPPGSGYHLVKSVPLGAAPAMPNTVVATQSLGNWDGSEQVSSPNRWTRTSRNSW
jgi:hypothetical protein